jgi:hypothetical protein
MIRLLKINEVFGRPRRASESCSSTLIKDELVAPSDLIDGDPFANLCVGASRVCNIRVALAPLPPAQNSGPNLPQLQGALPRVPPNQDFAQPTLVAHKAVSEIKSLHGIYQTFLRFVGEMSGLHYLTNPGTWIIGSFRLLGTIIFACQYPC